MHEKWMTIIVLFVMLASALLGCSGTPSHSSTLTILSITEGNVFVMKAGADDWTEATLEMSLEVGDIIKTGDDSGAEITFFDGSTIELEAGTQIEITSLDTSPDTGTKTITLMQTIGTTVSRVTALLDPASTYAIETPSGVAAVRGTTMIVRIASSDDPNYEVGTVLITCVEGDIWLIWNGVELHIGEGYTCVIRPDGVVEILPSNELPQEETGDVTDEDTSDGEDEDQQPDGSANGSLNNPPVAVRDTILTEKNTSVTINVLNNDSDVDGDELIVSSVTQGAHGSVASSGGDVAYTPDSGFTGTDHFTYTISDGNGGTDTATVTVFTIDVSELEFPVTPPADDQSDEQGGDENGGDETPPADGEAIGRIHVTTPADTVPIFIQVETAEGEKEWAIDLNTDSEVDGTKNFGVSDVITLAANQHYYVWVGGDVYYEENFHGWESSDAPEGYDGQQADGELAPDHQQNLKFRNA
jgi:hypothetical protein